MIESSSTGMFTMLKSAGPGVFTTPKSNSGSHDTTSQDLTITRSADLS